jgi:hypothetical protein
MMRLVTALLIALMLAGCSQSEFKQLETGAVAGTFNGHPVEISWKRDTSGRMIVDLKIPTAVSQAASIATGGWSDLAGELIAFLTAAAGTGGYALSQRSARRRAEQDAVEGWSEYKAEAARSRELALRVPATQ